MTEFVIKPIEDVPSVKISQDGVKRESQNRILIDHFNKGEGAGIILKKKYNPNVSQKKSS